MLGMLGLFEYLPKEEAENTTDTDAGIANTRKNTAIIGHECCQSPVSLDTLRKDCKRPVHRGFVSLSVSIVKFSDLETKAAD